MLLEEGPVGVDGVGTPCVLPVAVLAELRDPRARLAHQLTVRMTLYELAVGVDRVRPFGSAPILLLPATAP
jgi:hypothetical protein